MQIGYLTGDYRHKNSFISVYLSESNEFGKNSEGREEVMNNKIISVLFFVGVFMGLPQFVLAGEGIQEQKSAWKLETKGWSVEDHMVAAKAQEEEAQSLESRVQEVNERIANLEKKPYFDPKGIKRSGLKLLSGNFKNKLNLLNEKVAWHYRQADQAKLLDFDGGREPGLAVNVN
jgi:hypothetical protein